MKPRRVQLAAALVLAATATAASADVVLVTDRGAFNALGSIAHNSSFDDFGAGFNVPGDPFTRGDVTYASDMNITVGAGTEFGIGSLRTLISNNYFTGLAGTIAALAFIALAAIGLMISGAAPTNESGQPLESADYAGLVAKYAWDNKRPQATGHRPQA